MIALTHRADGPYAARVQRDAVQLNAACFDALRRTFVLRSCIGVFVFLPMQCVSGAQQPHLSENQPGAEFKLTINANMVLLNATVLDRHNALVSGLNAGDFQIYEDGVPQTIRHFTHEDIPVTAGILVDNSSSMGPKRSDVIAAALAFAGSSNPQDQMFVVNFSDHVSFGLPARIPFTDQREQLQLALSSIRTIGETALYDGIVVGLEHLQLGNRDKKVLILITDGGDNASKNTLAQVMALTKQSAAIIYAIGIFDEQDGDQNPGVLKRFAKETGGEAFFPESSKEIAPICEKIARDIRNQYSLAYVPSNARQDGSFRTIEVKASAPGHGRLSVRTRTGYTAAVTSPPATREAIEHVLPN